MDKIKYQFHLHNVILMDQLHASVLHCYLDPNNPGFGIVVIVKTTLGLFFY